MNKQSFRQILSVFILCILLLSVTSIHVFAVTPVTGIEVTGTNVKQDGDTVTGGCSGLGNSSGSIEVAYTGTEQAVVKFKYKAATSGRGGTASFNGTALSTGTTYTYSQTVEPGTIGTFTLAGAKFGGVSVTLSDFEVSVVQQGAKATVYYDTTKGSVTLGGESVGNGGSATVNSGSVSAVATVIDNNHAFLGWVDQSTHKILSTSANTTLSISQDTNIEAIFVNKTSDTAWFLVGGEYVYNNLNQAATKATSLSNKTVFLMNSGTLSSTADNPDTTAVETGYTIPEGVKLLIPNSASDTGAFGGEPSIQIEGNITTNPAKVFRTLTVPSGMTITCYGEINVNGHRSANGQPFDGHVIGDYGKIILGTESTTFSDPTEDDLTAQLIIENTGKLYCYGYITGSGMVHVKESGTVHELLQLADWPGGSNGITWSGDNYNNLFLATQYYIQNIEAPLKLEHGATQYVEAVITISLVGEIKFSAPFISSSDGLFITSGEGYFLRIYDQAQDRMNYHIKGGSCTIGVLSMKKTIYGVPYSITTENSIMPITNNISIYIEDSATFNVNKPVAILPGAEVTIQSGATTNVENAAIYIYDVSDWSGIKESKMASYFNRVQQSISESWTSRPSDLNTDPKTNPLPYVATLDDISPRATAYYHKPSDKGQPQTNPKPITVSGKLEVNGTLNIKTGGYAYASSDGASADKTITGTGKIIHNGSLATAAKSIASGTDTYAASVNFNNALGNLAGVGAMKPFTNAGNTYFGLGEDYNHYWYQHVIMVADGAAGVIPYNSVGETGGYASNVRSNTTSGAATNQYVVGYAVTGGSFSFRLSDAVSADVCKVKVGDTELTATNGVYTISNIAADCTITLVAHTSVTDEAKAPTCTETGLTEGKHCGVCSAVLVSQEVVSALSHDHQLIETVEATCTEDGHMTYGCSRCDDGYTETLAATGHTPDEMVNVCYDDQHCTVCNELMKPAGHTYPESGGPCTVCGLFEIYASSLRAGDSLKLYFYVQSARMPDLNVDASEYNYRAEIIRSKEGVKQDPEYIPASQWTDFGGGLYRFSYDGIAAKEMTDDLVVTIYKKNGDSWVAITNSKTESVAGYAVRYLTKGFSGEIVAGSKDAVLRTALVDMLNYGAACQAEFGYNTGNLANKDITAYQGYKTSDVTPSYLDNKFSYFAGSTVTVKNSLVYTFYAKESALGKTARITYTDHYGVTHTWTTTITNATTTTSNGNTYYGVRVTDLAIADGRQKITCELLDGDTVIETVYGSVEDYVYSQLLGTNQTSDVELRNAVQCLMNFIDSAYKYFHFDDTTT